MQIDLILIDAALNLRASAPMAWEQFVRAVDLHAARLAADLVKADLSRLQVGQGQAQSMRQFADALARAPAIKEQLMKKSPT